MLPAGPILVATQEGLEPGCSFPQHQPKSDGAATGTGLEEPLPVTSTQQWADLCAENHQHEVKVIFVQQQQRSQQQVGKVETLLVSCGWMGREQTPWEEEEF